jgi:hypothetical protein
LTCEIISTDHKKQTFWNNAVAVVSRQIQATKNLDLLGKADNEQLDAEHDSSPACHVK